MSPFILRAISLDHIPASGLFFIKHVIGKHKLIALWKTNIFVYPDQFLVFEFGPEFDDLWEAALGIPIPFMFHKNLSDGNSAWTSKYFEELKRFDSSIVLLNESVLEEECV